MAAVLAILDFESKGFLAIFISTGRLLLHHKFRLNLQSDLRGDVENNFFQNDHCGGHLLFRIGISLAIFDLEIILLLQCKFQLNLPNGLGGEVKNWFSR